MVKILTGGLDICSDNWLIFFCLQPTLKLFASHHNILITSMVRDKALFLLYFLSLFTWLSMDKLWNVLENNVSNDFISKYVSDFSCWESYPMNS